MKKHVNINSDVFVFKKLKPSTSVLHVVLDCFALIFLQCDPTKVHVRF